VVNSIEHELRQWIDYPMLDGSLHLVKFRNNPRIRAVYIRIRRERELKESQKFKHSWFVFNVLCGVAGGLIGWYIGGVL